MADRKPITYLNTWGLPYTPLLPLNLQHPLLTTSKLSHFQEGNELQKQLEKNSLYNLSKPFHKTLLPELTSEDTWMDRFRRVIERGDNHEFELMGQYTNPSWNQTAVQDDCILADNRLAVPVQLRLAVLKRIPDKYCSCTRNGKIANYQISKNAS